MLGFVSGVESYFRSLLARVINSCHICRIHSAKQSLTLAAIDYYSPEEIGLGLLENVSFASEGEIVKQTNRISGIEIRQGSSLAAAITKFEAVAHLRHAAVHSGGTLNSKNFTALGLERTDGVVLILRLSELHAVVGICRAVVRAYNRFLYVELIKRWVKSGAIEGEWSRDRERFSGLYRLFRSERDGIGPKKPHLAYKQFRRGVGNAI